MVRDTSIEAYRNIRDNGLLSLRRWQVYEALYNVGPATGGEVFKEMKRLFGMAVPTNSNTTTRLGELREFGVASELGKRDCSVSGQNVTLWDVTSKLPQKPVKVKKFKCPHCEGTGYTKTAQDQNSHLRCLKAIWKNFPSTRYFIKQLYGEEKK